MSSFKILLGVLFGLVVVTITALAIISYQNNKTSLQIAKLVRHTNQVLDQTSDISSLFRDIQLESNTYFANRDSSIIFSYVAAKEEIYRRINSLKVFTIDNPKQQSRIDSLRLLVDDLIEFTNAGVSPKLYAMADLSARVIRNFQYRQQIRAIIHSIKQEEQRLLLQRENAYRLSVAAFNKASFLLLAGLAHRS